MTYLGYTGNKTDFGIAQVFSLFMAGISPRLDGFHTQHGCYQLGGPPEAGVLQYHLWSTSCASTSPWVCPGIRGEIEPRCCAGQVCVCVGDTLEQKDGNYPPGIKRGKLGKSIINGGLFYPENQLEIGSCGNCPLPRLMTRGYLLTNLENHPRIPPLVAVLSSGGCQYE